MAADESRAADEGRAGDDGFGIALRARSRLEAASRSGELDLSYFNLGTHAALRTARAHRARAPLRVLRLTGNGLDDPTALAEFLLQHPDIERVHLDWNCLSKRSDGLEALCRALARSSIEVDLRSNGLDARSAESLLPLLGDGSRVRSLDLSWNPLCEAGVSTVIEALRSGCASLLELRLVACGARADQQAEVDALLAPNRRSAGLHHELEPRPLPLAGRPSTARLPSPPGAAEAAAAEAAALRERVAELEAGVAALEGLRREAELERGEALARRQEAEGRARELAGRLEKEAAERRKAEGEREAARAECARLQERDLAALRLELAERTAGDKQARGQLEAAQRMLEGQEQAAGEERRRHAQALERARSEAAVRAKELESRVREAEGARSEAAAKAKELESRLREAEGARSEAAARAKEMESRLREAEGARSEAAARAKELESQLREAEGELRRQLDAFRLARQQAAEEAASSAQKQAAAHELAVAHERAAGERHRREAEWLQRELAAAAAEAAAARAAHARDLEGERAARETERARRLAEERAEREARAAERVRLEAAVERERAEGEAKRRELAERAEALAGRLEGKEAAVEALQAEVAALRAFVREDAREHARRADLILGAGPAPAPPAP